LAVTEVFPGLGKEALVNNLSWQIGRYLKAKGIKPLCHTGENPVCPNTLRKLIHSGTLNVKFKSARKYCGYDRTRIS
jgi:hypothetical protein